MTAASAQPETKEAPLVAEIAYRQTTTQPRIACFRFRLSLVTTCPGRFPSLNTASLLRSPVQDQNGKKFGNPAKDNHPCR